MMTPAGLPVPDTKSMASRLFSVLGVFTGAAPGRALTLTEIARHAHLPISTTHRLIGELLRCQALDRRPDGSYTIGFRMWEIGAQTPAFQMLRSEALPYLEQLHGMCGLEVQLVVLDGDETVCVEILAARTATEAVHPALRAPAVKSAAGTVLLAHAAEVRRRDHVHVDAELDAQRRRRDAQVRLEGVARLRTSPAMSVAAAIRNRDGEVVAALSVSYVGGDTRTRAYDNAVRHAARGISRALSSRAAASRRQAG